MDYHRASDIRKQGLMSLMTERLSSGYGTGPAIRGAISDKTKATFTGIKQKFDPLNIAKVVTGGSKFAPAMVGALTGRSKEDIGFFTGKKRENLKGLKSTSGHGSESMAEALGLIYRLMLRIEADRKLELEEKQNKQEEIQSEENSINDALIEALTSRKRKKPTKKSKQKLDDANKEVKDQKDKTDNLPKTTGEKLTSPPKEVTKPTVTPPSAPTKAPAPKVPTPSTAAKVATGAAIITAGLGSASAKFESRGDASTVSTGKNDPGGISYGTYQMSSVQGVADDFVKKSKWNTEFKGMKSGTPEFSAKWKEISKDPKQAKEFADAQHDYIKKTHFDPAAKVASDMGYNLSDAGVADAIWSLSVQHGNYKAVLNLSKQNMGGLIKEDPKEQIKSLYKARSDYVGGNAKLNADMKASIQKRYSEEVNYALDKSTGNKLDMSSKENKELKSDSEPITKVKNDVNTTNINSKTLASNQPIREDDSNPLIKKAQQR